MNEQSLLSKDQEEFEKNSKWFFESISLLRKKNLTGNFIAIKNRNIVAYNKNIEIVIRDLEKMGENPSYILIEYVYPEETIILL